MDIPQSTLRASDRLVQLSRKLAAAKLYWLALRAAEGAGGVAASVGGALLLLLAVDALLAPPAVVRLALLAVAACAVGASLLFFLLPLLRRVDDMKVAARVESQHPELEERLLTAVELTRGRFDPRGLSDALLRAAVADGARASLQVDFRQAFDKSRAKRRGGAALSCWGVFALVALFASSALGDSFRRYQLAYPEWMFERHGKIKVTPGDTGVLEGSEVTVEAEVRGGEPQSLDVSFAEDGKGWRTASLIPHPSSLIPHHTFTDLTRSLRYRVLADPLTSPTYEIKVVAPPKVTHLQLEYHYPDYTGWSPQFVEDADGDMKALRGTQVTLVATANRAVKEAGLRVQGSGFRRQIPMTVSDGKTLRGELTLKQPATYTIELKDQHGFTNRERRGGRIAVFPDKTPNVEIASPKNITALPNALIPVTARAEDDFGIVKFAVSRQRNNQPIHSSTSQPTTFDPPNPTAAGTFAISLSSLKAKPGDVITYQAWAQDNDTISGPKRGRSKAYKIKVVSVGEFLKQLERYQQDLGKTLNQLWGKQSNLLQKNQQLMRQWQKGEQVSGDRLSQLAQEQKALAEQTKQLAEEIKRLQEESHLSNLATPFEGLEERLESLANQQMSQAAQNLQNARQQSGKRQQAQQSKGSEMKQAEEKQRDAADALDTMRQAMREMEKEKQLLQMLQEAMRLRTEQQAIAQSLENANAQQMQQGAQKQQELAKETERLGKKAKELAKEFQKEDPLTAQKLDDVPNLMQREQLPQKMQQSAQNMQSGKRQQAQQSAQQAEESLRELEEYLKQTYQEERLGKMRRERDYLGQTLYKVEKLLREEQRVIEETERLSKRSKPKEQMGKLPKEEAQRSKGAKQQSSKAANPATPPLDIITPPRPPDFSNMGEERPTPNIPQPPREHPSHEQLSREQGRIAGETEGLQDELRWLLRAIPQLRLPSPGIARESAQPMRRAQSQLGQQRPDDALPNEQRGKEGLERIANALRQAFQQQQGGGQQSMGGGQQQALNLAQLQERLNERTQQLDRKGQWSPLSPREQLELDQMARQEELIRQAITQARNMFGGAWSPDTRSIVDQARRDLRDVEQALPQQQTGKETQEKQRDILAALLRIGNEMSGQQDSGQQQPQQGLPVTFGGQQPMQPQPANAMPNSQSGRLTEHGPAMKFVPETLKSQRGQGQTTDANLRQPPAVNKPAKRGLESRPLPQYERATGEYFKRIGK